MQKIGITGGIGSGKSLVASVLKEMGFPVFNSDEESKKILMTDPEVSEILRKNFGESILDQGKPSREKLASVVFSAPEKLQQLNAILHPRVKSAFSNWVNRQNSRIIFKEAALLISAGSYRELDKLIVVTSPIELRVKRVMMRDKSSENEVIARMKNQMEEKEMVKYAHFVIVNDESHALLPQINSILKQIRSEC